MKTTKAEQRLIDAIAAGRRVYSPGLGESTYTYQGLDRAAHEPLRRLRAAQVDRLLELGLLVWDAEAARLRLP